MIFNSLDFMNSLALDRYAENFGNKYKLPAIAKRYRSSMMLNPLNLKHLKCEDRYTSKEKIRKDDSWAM